MNQQLKTEELDIVLEALKEDSEISLSTALKNIVESAKKRGVTSTQIQESLETAGINCTENTKNWIQNNY